MREIKFRAWDTRFNMMTDPFEFWNAQLMVSSKVHIAFRDELVLMQYTGLKDKNGVEIYEGDIVESKDWHKAEDGSTILSDANSYMKRTLIDWRTALYQGFYVPSKCEVIGNIYENPELLETK